MKLKKNVLRVASYFGLGVGSVILFGTFVDGGHDTEPLRAAISFLLGGGISRFFYWKEKKKYQELELVRFAMHNYGRLTVPEVAVHFNITLEQSRKMLDKMSEEQVFHLEISQQGAAIYNLSDFSLLDDADRPNLGNKAF